MKNEPLQSDSPKPLRCLVVDDDPIIRLVLSGFLRREGLHVESAQSGEEGIELARCFQPDLIFMDIEMPGINGIETTKRIRSAPELTKRPFIIAFTSLQAAKIQDACFEAEMDSFLGKPFRSEVVKMELNRWAAVCEERVSP
jgi:CheY-like chemotaxis protein